MYNDIPKLVELAKRGFAIGAMEYRESDIAKFPAQIEDVANALDFIKEKAEQFHFDMERLFLMGNSSGGHIATMAALFDAHGLCKKLPKVSGVICECGSNEILICANEELPSMCIFHSENDPVVSVENSRTLYKALETNGHQVEYYELENNDAHCGAIYFSEAILDIIQAFCERC